MSEIDIHSLLVEYKLRGLERGVGQDPDRDRNNSDEEGIEVDHAAYELELIALTKCPFRLLPHDMISVLIRNLRNRKRHL